MPSQYSQAQIFPSTCKVKRMQAECREQPGCSLRISGYFRGLADKISGSSHHLIANGSDDHVMDFSECLKGPRILRITAKGDLNSVSDLRG